MSISNVITEGFGPAGGSAALTILSVTPGINTITIVFSDDITLASLSSVFSNWTITETSPAIPMTITGLSYATDTLVLATTDATIGGSYTLNIPDGVIRTLDSALLMPPYFYNFVGVSTALTLSIQSLNDARTFRAVFSRNVVESEASVVANYSISPELYLISAAKIDNNVYELTSRLGQTPSLLYTVTASGIHDINGNLI